MRALFLFALAALLGCQASGPVKETRSPFGDREGYQVYRPREPQGPMPVILAIHGGGGTPTAQARQTCPDRRLDHPECLHRLATDQGWMVVYPTGSDLAGLSAGLMHGWNATTVEAGQDLGGWNCTTGTPCEAGLDDVAFFGRLLDDLEATYEIDPSRIYATGLSNGGAMSHRLGCQLSDRIAAIAPVAAGNQFAALNACEPARPVPVLQLHGSEDRCWPYDDEETVEGCSELQDAARRRSIPGTVQDWAARNGCDPEPKVAEPLDAVEGDGTSVVRITYAGCEADVVHLRLDGGGHTWPGGSDGLPESLVGRVSGEVSANRELLDFFAAHPRR